MLHIGGLRVVGSVFRQFPNVEWVTGRPTVFHEDGMTTTICALPGWSRWRFLAGANLAIQQESTYWRRSLWEKAGGYTDSSRRMAMDYELWVRFFRHAQIFVVDSLIGGWRQHSDSLALQHLAENYRIIDEVTEAELRHSPNVGTIKMFRRVHCGVKRIPKVRVLWEWIVTKALYKMPGPDWPPIIEYGDSEWRLRRR
jgi:hypothetical protein